MNIGSYDQYLYALVVLVGTAAAMVALLWVSQRSRWASAVHSFRGIAQNFMSVVSVLFALNIAFLAHDTWTAHDRALDAVFQEAGSLRNIVDLARHLPPSLRERITAAVGEYARVAVAEEWPALAHRETSTAASERLDALLTALVSDDLAAAAGSTVQSMLLQQAMLTRSTRDLRTALSRTHVNPLKWMGMAFLGFLTMVSIVMVHVDQPRAEILAVLIFAAAAAPTAAIILVHGNPFQEPAAVTSAPIRAIADLAGHEAANPVP